MADKLAAKVRIYCFILTMPASREKKAVHVKATWARHFDKFAFISSEDDPDFPVLKAVQNESRKHLWLKTRFGFINAYRNHLNDFEFFMKADDDTYVIVENLRLLLSTKDPNVPILMGRRFKVSSLFSCKNVIFHIPIRVILHRKCASIFFVTDFNKSSLYGSYVACRRTLIKDRTLE
ncbi:unnamed protein product [Dibothriocephalus latus]|uniref:N-acetylgalactosaminide beta-1,3-galactosyltransferase n=1 Tax=Dibothriocephalus latus TaxID=60516 RepID=A0A3P7LAT6_DIBLA|nr:unnamed protein product [Dibothriocephalus latus]